MSRIASAFSYLSAAVTARHRRVPGGALPREATRRKPRRPQTCGRAWRLALSILAVRLPAQDATHTLLLGAARAGDAAVVVGERGAVLRSDDNAATWVSCQPVTTATLTAVSFANDRSGWVVGHDALILVSHDGGRGWSRQWQGENLSDSFLHVLALDGSHVIAIGAYGLFAETGDGGATWRRRRIQTEDYHLNRITQGPDGTLFIAGEHGTVLRSKDHGATWTALHLPYEGSFYGVLPLDRRTLLAYGLRGRVYRSADGGESWSDVEMVRPSLVAAGLKLGSNFVLLAGELRTIVVSRDYGHHFVPAAGTVDGISDLLELADGNVLAVGEAGAWRIDAARLTATAANPGS